MLKPDSSVNRAGPPIEEFNKRADVTYSITRDKATRDRNTQKSPYAVSNYLRPDLVSLPLDRNLKKVTMARDEIFIWGRIRANNHSLCLRPDRQNWVFLVL